MRGVAAYVLGAVLLSALPETARAENGHAHHAHHHHAMSLDRDGMAMNENHDTLPEDCSVVSEDVTLEVKVGRRYAQPGLTFGFSEHEWRVAPCARITVTLVNEDAIRHQWMVHGLPRYLYPQGMFHLEASGGKRRTGTFIVPSDDRTYLAHCDVSQHMEQGLKAQLVVGAGDGALPSIPGITGPRLPDRYRE